MNNGSAGDLALATSSGTGLILAINEYATVISLSLTAIGILVGIVFHVLALKDRRKQIQLNRIQEPIMPDHTKEEKRKNRLSLLRKQKDKTKTKPKTGHKSGHKS